MRDSAVSSVLEISEYVLHYCSNIRSVSAPITNLQLQKFLYYIQGYSLKTLQKPAYREDIYHWKYGPVVPEAYYKYCQHVRKPITVSVEADPIVDDRRLRELIDEVCEKCLSYSASQLVEKTHHETPWEKSGELQPVALSLMKSFFDHNDPLALR